MRDPSRDLFQNGSLGLVVRIAYSIQGIERPITYSITSPTNIAMPSSSEPRIEELCDRIRHLCRGPFSPESEAELRKLARQLRFAVSEHLETAKSSLSAKKKAIIERDPDEK
jgi:hypothetical protein